jgi:hypothetical protein
MLRLSAANIHTNNLMHNFEIAEHTQYEMVNLHSLAAHMLTHCTPPAQDELIALQSTISRLLDPYTVHTPDSVQHGYHALSHHAMHLEAQGLYAFPERLRKMVADFWEKLMGSTGNDQSEEMEATPAQGPEEAANTSDGTSDGTSKSGTSDGKLDVPYGIDISEIDSDSDSEIDDQKNIKRMTKKSQEIYDLVWEKVKDVEEELAQAEKDLRAWQMLERGPDI